jgi:putative transposase
MGWHDQACQLQTSPLPASDDHLCRLALLPFPLSLRLVEERLLERAIVVSYESVRRWALKFGPDYAHRLKRKIRSRHDIWHLDEVVITIAGEKHWLWRAVDHDSYVPDEIVRTRRNTKAAKRLLIRLLKRQGCPPRRMITDKFGSYASAQRLIMPAVEHRSHKGLNSRDFAHSPEPARTGNARLSVTGRFAALHHSLRGRGSPSQRDLTVRMSVGMLGGCRRA